MVPLDSLPLVYQGAPPAEPQKTLLADGPPIALSHTVRSEARQTPDRPTTAPSGKYVRKSPR